MSKDTKELEKELNNYKKIILAIDKEKKEFEKNSAKIIEDLKNELATTKADADKIINGDTNEDTGESTIMKDYMDKYNIK